MTPAQTIDILRQLHAWLKGGTQWAPTRGAEAVEAAVEMIERVASLPRRITPEQAPDGVRDYCHEAAEGYADGWNDCIEAALEESK